jgi:endonuclease/exonuclease/phosphatase family metal-dependent hydrolase
MLERRELLSGSPHADNNATREVTVMSRNVYVGFDATPVIEAVMSGDPNLVVPAVTAAWQAVQATNFPERAEALADEVIAHMPDLIGLQEVSTFYTGTALDPQPADQLELDYLEILLDELDERGLSYEAVAVFTGQVAEFPGFTSPGVLQDIRVVDHDVILARADLPTSQLKLSNPQAEAFDAHLVLPLPGGQQFHVSRGWTSVDAKIRGKEFRFINTHLEPFNPATLGIQSAQAQEILIGPAAIDMPVILVGDFNSDAEGSGPVSQTYTQIIAAGFTDAWSEEHPNKDGYTFGHDADLRNPKPDLDSRIDLVLYRGNFRTLDAEVVGDKSKDRTPSGLWPSDHAGVMATLAIGSRQKDDRDRDRDSDHRGAERTTLARDSDYYAAVASLFEDLDGHEPKSPARTRPYRGD